jgi:hypothetical protein
MFWRYIITMNAPHRMTVTWTADRAEFLKQEAARLNISMADLLRRIIDAYRAEKEKQP